MLSDLFGKKAIFIKLAGVDKEKAEQDYIQVANEVIGKYGLVA